eukprot:m.70535 g.70535  ORF g.70535 m.70535 type:complete len:474 (+) comp35698_c0_seq4:34-1455(+)
MLSGVFWRRVVLTASRQACRTRVYTSNLLLRQLRPRLEVPSLIGYESFKFFRTAAGLHGKVIPFVLSDIGEGIAEVTIKEWHVKVGDSVQQFDNVCEVQSDKATVTITSRYDGVIRKIYYEEDDVADVGKPLVDIEVESETAEVKEEFVHQSADTDDSAAGLVSQMKDEGIKLSTKVLTTPAVRRIAKEEGIDLSTITGTGKGGRILKEDVLNKRLRAIKKPAETPAHVKPTKPQTVSGQDQIKPIRGFKKAMVKTMTQANRIPHFGYSDEVAMDALVQLRMNLNDQMANERGIRLSYMPFFIKAASAALTQYPVLNSHLNDDCTEILFKASHNIGVAVDSPDGLIVPNVKAVQSRSIYEIALELRRLRELATAGRLGADDLSGGSFTLSNIGMIGGTYVNPVILPPEVCIGGIGRMQLLPRFDQGGDVVATHVMAISWSADHRVIDGATVARFSNLWKSYLEEPGRLLVDLR